MRFRAIWGALFVCLATASSAIAQTTAGEIVGRVTDSSDALLPGVSVTVTGTTLLQPLTTTSSENGSFRFSGVPIGTYSVKFELTGFSNVVRENVRISAGFVAQINIAMAVSSVEETVLVSSESPVVDTTKTGSVTTFSKEVLEIIPSSRDPWVMMEQTPSIVMDRANVGGSQSGQQSGFVVRGANTTNNVWSLDGVNVTDMSATGATTMYYNFDNFEEMQFNVGGNDVTQPTGGMGINLVTKSGGDLFKGTGRYMITDNAVQADNVTDELRAVGASAGNPIQTNTEAGIQAGGPILRGRAWFWGSVGRTDVKVGVNGFFKKEAGCPTNSTTARQVSTETLRGCLSTDQTLLKNYTWKLTGRTFGGNRAEWFADYADKFRNARDASALRPPETVVVQSGPVWTHKINDQQVFTDRWLGEFQYAFVGGGFALDFPNPEEQFSVQRYFEETDSSYQRSFSQSLFNRPLYLIDARTTYFLPSVLGGDHAFKMGYSFRHAPVDSYTHIGGFVEARFRNSTSTTARMYRDSSTSYVQNTNSFYAQDEYQAGRFTMRLGLRFDQYKDEALPSSVDPNPIIPDLLPAVSFKGISSGIVWNELSPRFGLNYDVRGSGKTIIGLTLSRYYGQPGVGDLSATLNPVTQVYLGYPWNDKNGDKFVTRDELDLTAAPEINGNYNLAAPGSPTTINTIDPNLKDERTDEVIVGLQHELLPGIGVQANYIWRNYDSFRWTTDEGITSAVYEQVTTTPTGCFSGTDVAAPCPSITYFRPTINVGGRKRTFTNRPGYNRDYNGFELSVSKRYSKKWFGNASVAYNSAIDHYPGPDSYIDPTNIAILDGAQWAAESGGSGVSNVWVNSKWVSRVTAGYTLPYQFTVSGFLNGHQGYILPYGYTTGSRGNGAAATTVVFEPYGESRLPSFWQFDFKVERPVKVSRLNLRPNFTVFNVANSNVILGRQRNVGTRTYNEVLQILGPRVIQFAVRVDF